MKNVRSNEVFSSNLRKVRKKIGLTQEKLANNLGTATMTISKYERKGVNPILNILTGLFSNFNVNLNWLLNDEDNDDEMFRKEKSPDYGIYSEEKEELDFMMDNIPFIREEILKHFIITKYEFKEEIKKHMEERKIEK